MSVYNQSERLHLVMHSGQQTKNMEKAKEKPQKNKIEKTTPEEDKIRDINDPEEKGPFIN